MVIYLVIKNYNISVWPAIKILLNFKVAVFNNNCLMQIKSKKDL